MCVCGYEREREKRVVWKIASRNEIFVLVSAAARSVSFLFYSLFFFFFSFASRPFFARTVRGCVCVCVGAEEGVFLFHLSLCV